MGTKATALFAGFAVTAWEVGVGTGKKCCAGGQEGIRASL